MEKVKGDRKITKDKEEIGKETHEELSNNKGDDDE